MLYFFMHSTNTLMEGNFSRNTNRFLRKTAVLIFLAFALAACTKEKNEMATIIKNCTGVYIQVEGKNFLVCNEEIFADFNNGSSKRVVFKRVKNCNYKKEKEVQCMMYFQHEGKVEVLEVE